MTARYTLLPAAEADLRDIIRYTRKQWGGAQARAYARKLETGIENMIADVGGCWNMDAFYPGLRVIRCEHHIFCIVGPEPPVLVAAIFHERMDLMVRIGARLD